MGARRAVGRPRGRRQLIGWVGLGERLGDADPGFRVVPEFRDGARPDRAACGCRRRILTGASGGRHPGGRYVGVRLLRRNTGRRPDRLSVRPFSSPSDPVNRIAKPPCPVHSRRIAAKGYVRSTLPTQSTRATPRSVRARERSGAGRQLRRVRCQPWWNECRLSFGGRRRRWRSGRRRSMRRRASSDRRS